MLRNNHPKRGVTMNKPATEIARCQFPSLMEQEPTLPRSNERLIYMSFVGNRDGWHCRFHRDDLRKTPISRQLVFQSAEKIYEAARRGNGLISVESRQNLDEAITTGRGGIWLRLTENQYSALPAPSPERPRKQ
jgi:hypothetical protein